MKYRLILLALLGGMLMLLCGCGRNHGSALLVVQWPDNASTATVLPAGGMALLPGQRNVSSPTGAPTDLRYMRSIVVAAYKQRASQPQRETSPYADDRSDHNPRESVFVASYTINRPATGNISRTLAEQIPTDPYRFVATAYDHPDGRGMVVGQAIGFAKIVKDATATVTLTTVSAPGMVMSLWPNRPVIYREWYQDFAVVLTNTDGSSVFYPENIMTWSVDNPNYAAISADGRATVEGVGEVRVTATDGRVDQSASTLLRIIHRPPVVSLTASSTDVHRGEAVNLYWATNHADRVLSYNFLAPEYALQGQACVYPRESTTYTIYAYGPGGMETASVTVSVRHRKKDKDED